MFFRVFVILLLITQITQADVDVENSNSEQFKVSGYLDGGFTEWGAYNTIPSREFSIRRSGFELSSEFTETLKANLKVEIRPDDIFLKDAVITWDPANWSTARFGQFKKETLLGGNISSWDLSMFDRPLVYDLCENLTYAGRDLGFDLRIKLPEYYGMELRGTAGIFNGDQRADERVDNELLYTFRGEIRIPSIDLILGASTASHRQGMPNYYEPSGYSVSSRQNVISADFSFDYEISNWYDLSLAGEYTTGDNWKRVDVVTGELAPKFKGLWGSLTASYHPWNIQSIKTVSISVSHDYLTPDTELEEQQCITSVMGTVYPTENLRFRFGGQKNSFTENNGFETNFTNFIAEIGLRF